MGTLSRALVYLVTIPVGFVVALIAGSLIVRWQGPPCVSGPCDAAGMSIAFSALLIGPIIGLAIGYGACRWLERGSRS